MVITISRQYFAGGTAVAGRVAETLGWTVIDDAVIEAVAARSGLTSADVQELEDRVPSFLERFALSSALSSPENILAAPSAIEGSMTSRLAHVTREVIEDLGQRERLVFVGHAAAAALARERDAIHVRLVASLDHRVRIAMERLGLDENEARTTVEARDAGRERYHREYFDRDWSDPVNYHLVLNTEALGVSGAAELIVTRARSLGG